MIEQVYITANGIKQHFLRRKGGAKTILFIHGNGSDSVFWEELMKLIPDEYTCLAPDLRGYGFTEAAPANATKSYGDFVEDLLALLSREKVESYIVVNHSLGGGISWELLLRDAARIEKMVFVNPASPFGFGGTKGKEGELTFPDGEGSGAGVVNPEFAKLVKEGDKGTENPTSPINVMNAFYWEPPFVPENLNSLLEGLLRMRVGEDFYPGDCTPSENFPFTKPGNKGQINCASPVSKRGILERLVNLQSKPPILWVRGGKDKIVSDTSFFDSAVLGKMGMIPDFPGEDACPAQPMVTQTRYALEQMGKPFKELVMENCGHSPYIEDLETFSDAMIDFLNE